MSANSEKPALPILERIDHLVLATPDLDAGVHHVEELLGVEAVPGGHHPVYGTRNALVALSRSCYLEIIGPDEKILNREEVRVFGIHGLEQPRLVTWAAKGQELEQLVDDALKEMIDLGGVTLGARRRPDGAELTWRFTDPLAARNGGVLPFFIDWGNSDHPAASLPQQCELLEMTLHHPHHDDVKERLRAIGLDMPVAQGDQPQVAATIRTPKGVAEL
ncbi:MAG: VOC family protein [Woeseia sp.]